MEFDKDFVLHDDIGSKTDIEPDIAIVYRYILLSFTAKTFFVQLICQGFFINTFQQSRAKLLMNRNTTAYYLGG